jgi:L-asparagine oxygenase
MKNYFNICEIFVPLYVKLSWNNILQNLSIYDNPVNHLDEFKQIIHDVLSLELIEKLEYFKTQGKAVVVRGCPIDQFILPTPYSGYLSPKFTPISCLTQLTIYSLLDIHPIVYQGENDGHLFRHVVPARLATTQKSSHGSQFEFGYHVDNPNLPLTAEKINDASACPEYLSLYGLRCDLNVYTRLLILNDVILLCSNNLLNSLQKPIFKVKRPDSFGSIDFTENLPIIQKNNQEYYSRFDTENVFPMNKEAENALNEFKNHLKNTQKYMLHLLPGDFLIFKNQQTMHSRDAFQPRMDGTDRWLMRLFGINDVNRIIFKDTNYKAVA